MRWGSPPVAESLDYVCAERLKPNLVWMAHHLAKHGELAIAEVLLEKLERVSVSTVRRMLRVQPRERPRLPPGVSVWQCWDAAI